jgi:hypothetical protein
MQRSACGRTNRVAGLDLPIAKAASSRPAGWSGFFVKSLECEKHFGHGAAGMIYAKPGRFLPCQNLFFRLNCLVPKLQKTMKKIILTLAIMAVVNLRLMAADAKDYQVTGPVLEVNASYIVVQKGDQKWQIAMDSSTKGDKPKVGDKVTVYYKMTATEIETKPAK